MLLWSAKYFEWTKFQCTHQAQRICSPRSDQGHSEIEKSNYFFLFHFLFFIFRFSQTEISIYLQLLSRLKGVQNNTHFFPFCFVFLWCVQHSNATWATAMFLWHLSIAVSFLFISFFSVFCFQLHDPFAKLRRLSWIKDIRFRLNLKCSTGKKTHKNIRSRANRKIGRSLKLFHLIRVHFRIACLPWIIKRTRISIVCMWTNANALEFRASQHEMKHTINWIRIIIIIISEG